MAAISSILARLKREPLDDFPIALHFEQLLRDSGLVWRDRLLGPLVTLRLFLIQILSGNCAITALRQLSGIAFAPSSYCAARDRLPLHLLQSLLHWMTEQAQLKCGRTTSPKMLGPRVLIADGSTFSTKDTPELRERFQLARGTKEGVGYPMGKLMGLLDAATGMFVSLLALPLFQHDLRSVISPTFALSKNLWAFSKLFPRLGFASADLSARSCAVETYPLELVAANLR
jgi:hypothetical protein